jgi:hypothetical protein
MYRVSYRLGERFEGVLIVERSEIGKAIERADLDLCSGWSIQAEPVSREDAALIPKRFIGRLLDEHEAAELDRVMVASIPKKPPAPSARRPFDRRRRRA